MAELTHRPEGQSFVIEASVGIAFYPRHGGDFTPLLRRADIDMPAPAAPAAERAAEAGCGHLLRRVMQ